VQDVDLHQPEGGELRDGPDLGYGAGKPQLSVSGLREDCAQPGAIHGAAAGMSAWLPSRRLTAERLQTTVGWGSTLVLVRRTG
jgi:hypothetical protein